MSQFKNKTLLITGGTGSFGNAVLNRFLETDIKEIRVFSRDELKQDNMRHEYQAKYPDVFHKLKFYIGDVRDINSIKNAMHGVDYVYHAAALKQVPSCEFFPIEAVKTNVLGTENVLTAAIESGVKRVVCLSTDKAAYPVNAMGTSKAMMEKVIVAKSRTVDPDKTAIMCTRYGNVLASRGSVVPLFINQIKEGNDLTVTDPTMTRFVMTLEEAVDLVLFAFELLLLLFVVALVPFNTIFCIALYVSLESNSLETTFPFKLLIIYVSDINPFAPFCFIFSVPAFNVASSTYFTVNGIVEIVFVSNEVVYSFSSFIPYIDTVAIPFETLAFIFIAYVLVFLNLKSVNP